MATNRADTLDPALLRPGRLDRKIEFPLPSRREKRLIFQTVTSKMNLGPDVDLEDCQSSLLRSDSMLIPRFLPPDVSRPDRLSSAEITSIIQAAGLQGMQYVSRRVVLRVERPFYSCQEEPICHSTCGLRGGLESEFITLRVFGTSFASAGKNLRTLLFSFFPSIIQQTVKRSDETHEFCECPFPDNAFLFGGSDQVDRSVVLMVLSPGM